MTKKEKEQEKKKTANFLKQMIGDYYLQIKEKETEVEHKLADKKELEELQWEFELFCDIYEIVVYNWEW